MQDNHAYPPAESRRIRGKPAAWLLSAALFIGLTVSGFAVVSATFGGSLPRLDTRLVQPQAIAWILAFLAFYFVSDGLRLYFVLRTIGSAVKVREIFPLVFINILFSNITPLATGGGFAQVWYLQRHGVAVGAAAAATTIRTILAMLAIFIAAPLFQFLHSDASSGNFTRITLQSLSGVILLYLIGFVILLRRPYWIAAPVERLFGLFNRVGLLADARRQRWTAALLREVDEFSGSFAKFIQGSRLFAAAAIVSTLVFLLTLFAFPALLLGLLDYEVDWLTVIGTLSVVTFLMYFAPTPGGAGFAELAFAGFMATRIGPADLLLVIFTWRFLTIYLGMAFGMVVSAFVLRPSSLVP